MANNIWIGLAHVRPWTTNRVLGDSSGAFVPVVGLAKNADELATLAATLLYHLQFDTVEVDDIELLATRQKKHNVEPDLLSMAKVLRDNDKVKLGAFQVYSD